MGFSQRAVLTTLLASISFVAISGATTGTLAWYAYSKNVTTSFTGTSVSTSLILRMGLVDDNHYLSDATISEYALTRESNDSHSIVWSNSATGYATEALHEYLSNSPYAVNRLYPVTSRTRSLTSTDELSLYAAYERGEVINNNAANKAHYVVLPFTFKVLGSDGNKLANRDIWLTDIALSASGHNVNKAVRIFVDSDETKFIMNPSDTSTEAGYTYVAGMLDLDQDGTYDFNNGTMKEYVYGDYIGTLEYETTPYDKEYEDAELDNVNNTPYTEEGSTFYARHKYQSYLAKYESLSYQKAEYYPFGKVKPSVNSEGEYYEGDTGIKIASTDSTDSVGYSTFTIYIEGWDFSVIDMAMGSSFNLGLEFNVNRF